MKKFVFILMILLAGFLYSSQQGWSANGYQPFGMGGISKSMGGTGIANPQSAVASVYLNPGAMIFTNRIDLGGSVSKMVLKGTTGGASDSSKQKAAISPAVGGVFHPEEWLVVGFAVVGTGEFGVDWRNTDLASVQSTTRVSITKTDYIFAGGLKLLNGRLGIGASFPISYQQIDLGSGSTSGMGLGLKLGAAYELRRDNDEPGTNYLRMGFYWKLPSLIAPKYGQIGLGTFGDPMELGIGISYIPMKTLVLNLNLKYIMWDSAKGWGDSNANTGFDWKDQFVIGFGLQYGHPDDLVWDNFLFRVGYNYGSKTFENNAILEGPSVVQHHVGVGMSFEVFVSTFINVGGSYGFANEETDTGGRTAKGSEWSLDIGMSGVFG